MPVFILYLFKVSVCLGVIYLFYYLALRNLTFYTWNRWYLLLGTGLSFLIPLIQVLPFLESREASNLKILNVVPRLENLTGPGVSAALESNTAANFFIQILPVIFILGLVWGGSKIIMQFFSFFRLRQAATCWQEGRIKIYQVNKNISPFSFGNAIYLNKDLLPPAGLQEIIRHEMVHIRQKHTLDVLWLEVISLMNWYNPLVWLLRRAVRENLEFLADSAVLATFETDKKYYQYLLLKVIGLPDFTFANQFNISSLKTRIIMMNKKPSTKRNLIKYQFALPIMAGLFLACQDTNDSALAAFSAGEKVPPPPPVVEELTLEELQVRHPEKVLQSPSLPTGNLIKYDVSPDNFPEDYKVFLKQNPKVKKIGWYLDGHIAVFFKSGEGESEILNNSASKAIEEGIIYNLNDAVSRAMAESSYGKLPKMPPPPPPAVK